MNQILAAIFFLSVLSSASMASNEEMSIRNAQALCPSVEEKNMDEAWNLFRHLPEPKKEDIDGYL